MRAAEGVLKGSALHPSKPAISLFVALPPVVFLAGFLVYDIRKDRDCAPKRYCEGDHNLQSRAERRRRSVPRILLKKRKIHS